MVPSWAARLAELRSGRELPNLVAVANRLAGVPWNAAAAAAQVEFVGAMLRRQPGMNPLRLARLAAENERSAWRLGLRELEELAGRDGFAFVGGADVPGEETAQSAHAGGSGAGDRDSGGRKEEGGERPAPEGAGASADGLKAVPVAGLAWFSLPARDWCDGGSVRMLHAADGSGVAVDIRVAGASWEFYWKEPERACLAFLPPAGLGRTEPERLRRSLAWLLGREKFTSYRQLTGDEWTDGFNFFDSDRILDPLDLVT
jgi:hypothetical protein